jgi:hypothetical protein
MLVPRAVAFRNSTAAVAKIVAAIGMLFLFDTAARAGPCTAQIDQLEMQIRLAASNPEVGPTAPQTIGAQLHHQPTPSAVQHAEIKANTEADAALERARKTDAQGDSRGCHQALREARRLYGL